MTIPIATELEDILRLRVLGVHVPSAEPTPEPPSEERSDEVDRVALSAQLSALGLDHGEIVDVTRFVASRPVALVRCADGTTLLVKWPHRRSSLRSDNEEFWLSALDDLGAHDFLRSALPRLLGVDERTGVIVLDGMTDCRSLSEVLAEGTGPTTEQWVRLAIAIATMHQLHLPEEIRTDPDRQPNVPIPHSFHLTPQEYAFGCGADFGEYVAVMQGVASELTQLRLDWQRTSMIHFDLTSENVLLGEPGAPQQVRLIDWELAGFGDPMYDVGSVLSQLIGSALRSQRQPGESPLSAWASVRPDATRFVTAYREVSGIGQEDVLRAVRYAGFGQLLSALGRLERIGSLGKLGNLALLIGRRILTAPESVADVLFGAGWRR